MQLVKVSRGGAMVEPQEIAAIESWFATWDDDAGRYRRGWAAPGSTNRSVELTRIHLKSGAVIEIETSMTNVLENLRNHADIDAPRIEREPRRRPKAAADA